MSQAFDARLPFLVLGIQFAAAIGASSARLAIESVLASHLSPSSDSCADRRCWRGVRGVRDPRKGGRRLLRRRNRREVGALEEGVGGLAGFGLDLVELALRVLQILPRASRVA